MENVLGLGESSDFRARLAAAHALPETLGAKDAETLFKGILAPKSAQGLPDSQWAALYNDVLNALGGMKAPLPDYPKRLLALVAQPERSEVLRDYALQHLLACIEYELEGEARDEPLSKAMELALAAHDTTLPGTCLLGVYQQAGKPGYPDAETIGKAALDIATDPEAFTPNRISAIQICGQLGYAPALPFGMELAKDEQLPAMLRCAAIATIGRLGSPEHQLFLRKIKYRQAPDFRIRRAAESALQQIKQ